MSEPTGKKVVGLHDGHIRSYERVVDSLHVSIITWQEAELKIVFEGVLAVVDASATGADLQELQECPRESGASALVESLLQQLVNQMVCSQADIDAAHLFRFLSLDDLPLLEIVCKNVRVEGN